MNGNTRVTQIADYAAVALVQIDVGQALNLVAIATTAPDRGAAGRVGLRERRHARIHGKILAKGAEASQ